MSFVISVAAVVINAIVMRRIWREDGALVVPFGWFKRETNGRIRFYRRRRI